SSAKSALRACWATLSARPPTMLSIARTANPLSRSRSTMWLPMNPAPPVTTAIGFAKKPPARGARFPPCQGGKSCGFQLLQAPDVEVERVLHAVRQLAGLERLAQVAHRILHGEFRLEAEHATDLVGVDMVRADVVGRRGDDGNVALLREFLLHDALGDLRDLHDGEVLESGVEDLACDLLRGRLEHQLVDVAHVLHVQVGPLLRAAEHRDLAC